MTTEPSPERPSLVVGVDGSAQSTQALRWAGRLAGAFGARIHVIGVWQIPAAGGWVVASEDWNPQEDTEKVVAGVIDEVFGAQRPADLQVTVGEGSAAQWLIHASETATLVVVGSRGHGGFAGLLLGAVSAHVAEHAHCPVMVVHGTDDPPRIVGR